jgi:DNA repair exonuclease SbcCD ATPase subunit
MAVFIDSLLYDSGLDVFDKKLENLKLYQKNVNEKPRVSCNIEATNVQNIKLAEDISKLDKEIDLYETTTIPELHNRIISGRTYVESLSTKLFKIDTEIYNLNVSNIKNDIVVHNQHIAEYKSLKSDLLKGISQLKETYNENRYKELIEKKDAHKTIEYNKKLEIKNIQQEIRDEEHKIEIINGEIFRLKQEGGKLKSEIQELKESKICPTCNQPLLAEHQQHLDEKIEKLVNRMYEIAGNIKNKEKDIDLNHKSSIIIKQKDIAIINELIVTSALEMENILKEIGDLTNDKNDVEKRKELQNELNTIPTKIQNEELKITLLQQKIDNFDNNLLQIQENQKIEKGIEAAKSKLAILEFEEHELKEDVYIKKTSIGEKSLLIKYNNDLIKAFEEQEYRDNVMHLYKKCVHRDGIPRQILVNYILPKINITLQNILATTQFKIWLDIDDLRPKLIYNNRPNAIIDCISASGKERTFASVVLKFALNQINVKTKPTIFLLDEIMGKLDLEGSVDEFIEILHEIKNYVKKILIIEHVHELNPNYLIRVELVDEGISRLSIE